jgi:hypothetical protein
MGAKYRTVRALSEFAAEITDDRGDLGRGIYSEFGRGSARRIGKPPDRKRGGS